MPATLAKLRAVYDPALKKIVDEAARRKDVARSKHLANLDALKKLLTISRDLDEALLVRTEKDRFATEMAEAAGVAVMKPTEVAGLTASKDQPFVNSLGMKFVPAPGTEALFCIWSTRVKDYAEYARVEKVDDAWKKQERDGWPVSREPDSPVVGVSWNDANAFCQWLTKRETSAGKLPKGFKYRLPTDEEWSRAAGLAEEDGATPKERSGKNQVDFAWGTEYPPSKADAGNYADAAFHEKFPKEPWLEGYSDGYATTSPVGSFPANAYGLYDMGGNVWQWCEDWFEAADKARVLRGASWGLSGRNYLLSSFRGSAVPGIRNSYNGFRCVVGVSAR